MDLDNYEEEIDLIKLLSFLTKKWKTIAIVTILSAFIFLGLSFLYNLVKPPIPFYKASTEVVVKVAEEKDKNKQIPVVIEIARSEFVINNVVTELKLADSAMELIEDLNVERQENTDIISINVLHKEPYTSKKIAQAIQDEVINLSRDAMNIEVDTTNQWIYLSETPIYEKQPVRVFRNGIIGGVLGMMGAVAFLVFKFMINDKIQTTEDVEKYLGKRVLTVIPFTEEKK